jgi:hypothetical protein
MSWKNVIAEATNNVCALPELSVGALPATYGSGVR